MTPGYGEILLAVLAVCFITGAVILIRKAISH